MDILNEEFGPAGPIGFLPETNPLFCAVLQNNLNKLKSLVESGQSVNSKNHRDSLLLNVVIEYKRTEIFDYLLSLTQLEINSVDNFGRSALLYAASEASDVYFASELIKKGADVNMADKSGATFLIRATSRFDAVNNLNLGQIVIEKGANIDATTENGVTALFAACEMGKFDWVCMLLYYGADPTIVPDDAVLPVVKLSHFLPDDQLNHLQEVLYDYTFDDTKVTVQLSTLVAAMSYDTPIFPKIAEITQDVCYDVYDLELFHAELTNMKAKHLALFLEKFSHIVQRMIENFPPLNILRRMRCPIFIIDLGYPNDDVLRLKEIYDVFLESRFVLDFVRTADTSFPTIFRLADIFRRNRIFLRNEEEEITKMVCVMLSYGLAVLAADAHAIFTYYGYCELFKILLHMDIDLTYPVFRGCVIPRLCYDPCKDIEELVDVLPSDRLLNYYSLPKVKKLYLAGATSGDMINRMNKLPQVPLLIELSRNASRKYIIKRFNIKNSKQFYTVLNWLPIGEMNKRIISLEKKLY